MRFTKALCSLLASASVIISFDLVRPQSATSRPVHLFDIERVVDSRNGTRTRCLSNNTADIMLGREIYSSLGSIRTNCELAFKMPAATNVYLDLKAAIDTRDNASPIKLRVYLNGHPIIEDFIVSPGKVIPIIDGSTAASSTKVKLTGRSDIAYRKGGRSTLYIEAICLSGSGCNRLQLISPYVNISGQSGI